MNTVATKKAALQAVPMVIVSPETTQTKAKKARKHNRGKKRKRYKSNVPTNPTNKSTMRSDAKPRECNTTLTSSFLHDATLTATKDSNSGESKICEVTVIHSDSSEDEEDSVGGYVYLTPPAKPHTLIPTLTAVKEEMLDPFKGFTEEDFEQASKAPPTTPNRTPHALFDTLLPTAAPNLTPTTNHAQAASLLTPTAATAAPPTTTNPEPLAPPNGMLETVELLGGITTLIYRSDGILGQEMLDNLARLDRYSSTLQPGIIPRTPQALTTNAMVKQGVEYREFGIDNLVNPVGELLSQLTQSLFGSVLVNAGVIRLTNSSTLLTKNVRG